MLPEPPTGELVSYVFLLYLATISAFLFWWNHCKFFLPKFPRVIHILPDTRKGRLSAPNLSISLTFIEYHRGFFLGKNFLFFFFFFPLMSLFLFMLSLLLCKETQLHLITALLSELPFSSHDIWELTLSFDYIVPKLG